MRLFKRASINVRRLPGKSLILLLLVFILGMVTTGAISVRSAIHTTDLSLRRNMRPVVIPVRDQAALDYEWTVLGNWDADARLTPEIIYEIGHLPYVDYFDYSMILQLWSFELDRWLPVPRGQIISHFGILDPDLGETFMVTGVSHPEFLDLQQGIIELVNGESFTDLQLQEGDHVAVVSSLWAAYNGLGIGDVFSMDNVVHAADFTERFNYQTYEFEIIGLFDVVGIEALDLSSSRGWGVAELRAIQNANHIYLPNTILREMVYFFNHHWFAVVGYEPEEESYPLSPAFVLNDPLDTIHFREAAMPLLPDFWLLSDLSNRFEPISTSMETMRGISDAILFVTIGASLVVLGLVITLFLRDRRHEVGIYLALGERRAMIIGQVLIEIVVIAVVGITLSIFAGNQVASRLSQNMLITDLTDVRVEERRDVWDPEVDRLEWLGFGPPLDGEEMLAFYDFSLDPQTIMLFYLVGLATVIGATAVPIFYLTRLSPRKVLL